MPKRPVRDFKCSVCGVLIKGVLTTGKVRATNRPYTDRVVEPCVCAACREKS